MSICISNSELRNLIKYYLGAGLCKQSLLWNLHIDHVCCHRCNVCGKEFYEKALFRRHVKKATHGKKGRVKQNLVRECEQCGRKFTQLREYRRHVNNHQGETLDMT